MSPVRTKNRRSTFASDMQGLRPQAPALATAVAPEGTFVNAWLIEFGFAEAVTRDRLR